VRQLLIAVLFVGLWYAQAHYYESSGTFDAAMGYKHRCFVEIRMNLKDGYGSGYGWVVFVTGHYKAELSYSGASRRPWWLEVAVLPRRDETGYWSFAVPLRIGQQSEESEGGP